MCPVPVMMLASAMAGPPFKVYSSCCRWCMYNKCAAYGETDISVPPRGCVKIVGVANQAVVGLVDQAGNGKSAAATNKTQPDINRGCIRPRKLKTEGQYERLGRAGYANVPRNVREGSAKLLRRVGNTFDANHAIRMLRSWRQAASEIFRLWRSAVAEAAKGPRGDIRFERTWPQAGRAFR